MDSSLTPPQEHLDSEGAPPDPLAVQMKIALVMSSDLDRGAVANRGAVMATGLALRHPEIVGPDLVTRDGQVLPGFTKVPIVVLSAREEPLTALAARAREKGLTTLVFLGRAQGMRSYEAYRDSVAGSDAADLDVDAVLLYGPRKPVNQVTGSLPALR
jgi:hypothetical protein